MNGTKFRDEEYPVRPIRDLRELLRTSADLYRDRTAYLVKETPAGPYLPITFGQFLADVEALGTALMELGLWGKKIAVIGENRYEWVVTYLATVCGLGVIVPLDKELPVAEIRNLLERSAASAILYSGKMELEIHQAISGIESLKNVINMDAETHGEGRLSYKTLLRRGKQLLSEEQRYYLDTVIDPTVMNMLLFTSGTTGLAKGVMLSHKNLCSNVYQMSKCVRLVEGDVGLSVLPLHHTYEFTCHILTSLYQGSTVAFCQGLKYIVKNMAEAGVTLMLGVPLIFESMHQKIWKQAEASGRADKLRKAVNISKVLNNFNIKGQKKLFKSVHQALGGRVRLFISGAAAIDPNVMEDVNAMGITMFQGYGLTESAPIVAVNKDRCFKSAAAGLPLPGTEIQIIDKDEFGIGEIICRSDSVMLGYYENPEETEKVLRDGWLHTGDYGYFDRDGFLYISGRKKNVIVTKNGKNIFPEEVEFYLNKSEAVKESLVWGMEEEGAGETIVCAAIVPDYEIIEEKYGKVETDRIYSLIKQAVSEANDKMPLYKRIKRFEIRETEFEKTTTKKIKRIQK